MITALLISATSAFKPIPKTCDHDHMNFRGVTYVSNYDADTVTVDIPCTHPLFGKKISVRIYGIDAPEMKSKENCEKQTAIVARDLVHKVLMDAKSIELRNVKRDKYFRVLADLYADDKSVGDILLKNNLAAAYFGDTKPEVNWCKI